MLPSLPSRLITKEETVLMKCVNGLWHYRGRTYATLREALLTAPALFQGLVIRR